MPLLTIADAAILFHRPPGTIRRWIHEDGIEGKPDPRLKGCRGRRNIYPGEQLQDAYERRNCQTPAIG